PDGMERLRAWVAAGLALHEARGWRGAFLAQAYFEAAPAALAGLGPGDYEPWAETGAALAGEAEERAFFTTLPDGLAEWTAEERALFLATTRALAAASPRRARILYRELPPAIGKLPADARAALLRPRAHRSTPGRPARRVHAGRRRRPCRGAVRRAARGPRPGGGTRGRAPRGRRRRPPRPAPPLRGGGAGRGPPLVRGRHGRRGGQRGRGPRLLRARVAHEPERAARGLDRSRARRHAGRVAETRPDALGRAGRGARRGGRDPPPAAGGPSRRARGRAPAPRRLAADARGQLTRLPPLRRH